MSYALYPLMMIFLIAFISFLLGFVTNLISLPYIVNSFIRGCWKYIKRITLSSVFRWSVSIVVSFTISILIVQYQKMRIQKQTEIYYQHIVDSLNTDLKVLRIHKVK